MSSESVKIGYKWGDKEKYNLLEELKGNLSMEEISTKLNIPIKIILRKRNIIAKQMYTNDKNQKDICRDTRISENELSNIINKCELTKKKKIKHTEPEPVIPQITLCSTITPSIDDTQTSLHNDYISSSKTDLLDEIKEIKNEIVELKQTIKSLVDLFSELSKQLI